MASAKFLEEALSTDVDESAVNAIVGTLETQLVTSPNIVSHEQQGIIVTSVNNNNSAIVSNGGPIISSQKHGVANGEIVSSGINNNILLNSESKNNLIITSQNNNIPPTNGNNNKNNTFVLNQVTLRQQKPYNNNYSGNINPHNSVNIASSNMPKSNEPIKVVYPTVGVNQAAVLNMNNRMTFTSQPLPNGSISLAPLTTSQASSIMQTSQAGGIRSTTQPQQTLVIKNQVSMQNLQTSSSPGIVTMTKTLNQSGQQNLVGTQTMIPASVQIVNMRPGTPTNQNPQKNVGGMTPTRVLIGGSTMVGSRPQNSGITLSSLQGGPGGSALILKTESGQFQLLRVGPAPPQQVTPNMVSSANQTIRLQTVPAVSRFTGPPLTLRKTIVTQQQQGITTSAGTIIVNSSVASGTQSHVMSTSTIPPPPIASVTPVPALAPQNTTLVTTQTQQQQRNTSDNTKEKCRKFLANLLELSSREPKPVEKNVRTLIQELIDANVEPEEFCERLERLLNASPQPCLIGFLKKSLPLLRQSLVRKELQIDGINAPPYHVAFSGTTTITTQIPAQVRQIGQTVVSTNAPVQNQIRMVTPTTIRPGQTTITRHTTPLRLPVAATAPRLINSSVSQIRPGTTTIVTTNSMQHQQQMQQQQLQQHHTPPQQLTTPPALQPIRGPTTIPRPPSALQIRATTPAVRTPIPKTPSATSIKLGQTQIKQIITSTPASIINTNNILTTGKTIPIKSQGTTISQKTVFPKEKEKKAAQAAFYQSTAMSMSSSMYGDDDINDVAAMGGVNLAEETQRIMGSTELIGTQIRSCKDEVFLSLPALQNKIRQIVARHGLEEPSNEVAILISHATQERLKNIVEKLAVIAEHRIDVIKIDPRYEITKDVRGQIKFLEELDKAEQKRHEEQEREMLLRAAKSRSKTEDPEQAKLKAKAKERHRAEMEESRQRDANITALNAIGIKKKPRLDGDAASTSLFGAQGAGTSGTTSVARPRIKRVNLRDMLFYLEQERDTGRSNMLYKAYLK